MNTVAYIHTNLLRKIREKTPLVHAITNYVVMNFNANALLAVGASPAMVMDEKEVKDMVRISSALLVNIGTLMADIQRASTSAVVEAKHHNVPVILDPVAVGLSQFRRDAVAELCNLCPPAIIRGNASEIIACTEQDKANKGVDSADHADTAINAAKKLSRQYQCVVVISGATDYIIDGDRCTAIPFGDAIMTKVTGMGCTATAMCAAFAGVTEDYFQAAAEAMMLMGVVGSLVAQKKNTVTPWGPAIFMQQFIDTIYSIEDASIQKYAEQHA